MIVMQSSISTVSNARKAGFAVLSHPCSHRGQKFAGPDEQAKLDRISSMFDPKFRWFPSKTPITSPLHPHYSHYIDIPNFFVFVQFVHKDPIGSHRIPVLYTKKWFSLRGTDRCSLSIPGSWWWRDSLLKGDGFASPSQNSADRCT